MKLIVTEMAQIKIECMGSVGIGTIAQGTIPISGTFTGSCILTPTYVQNTTIDGSRIVSKLNFKLTGFLLGHVPTTPATGSMQGKTRYDKDDNLSFLLEDQTANIINGVCTLSSTPFTQTLFSATASFINAGQSYSFGE